jgi:photosystem II stability/assembly factor-like uncharacterized protein
MQQFFKSALLFILLSISAYPQNYWEKINSPTTKNLNSIAFVDSLNGWVSSETGFIIHTSDGGESWDTQFTNDSLNIVNLFFVNGLLGYAAAWSSLYPPYGTYILKTTNAGLNWNKELFGIGEKFVNSFYFLDSLTGFAVGYPGVFIRTSDGGSTWNSVRLDSSVLSGFPPYTIKFYNQQYGYACGGVRDVAGVVWRTTDGGINWSTVVDNLASEPLFDIQIFDSLNVTVMGGDPEYGASVVNTTDGGENWAYTLLGVFWYPVSLAFRTSTEGWAPLGVQQKFLYTTDSGNHWIELDTPDSTNITRIEFTDSTHGFGIGGNGNIIKYVYPVVPVELTSFIASAEKNNILLNWSTATEVNNHGFEIQREKDNSGWSTIGFKEGQGTSSEPEAYSYTDRDLPSGKYLYRLKQVDFDGSYKYSKTVIIETKPLDFSLAQNYPNPFNPVTTIKYQIPQKSLVTLKVYNVLGKEVSTLVNEVKPEGVYHVEFNGIDLPSGIYFCKIQAGTFTLVRKMILLK